MKSKVIALFFLFSVSTLFAQQSGFGVGALIGEPTGISAKYWLNNARALDAAAGFSLFGNKGFSFHVDYLYHIFNSSKLKKLSNKNLPIAFFYGYGLNFGAGSKYSSGFGFRGVLGAEWLLQKYKTDIFIKIAPIFTLLPETGIDFTYAVGARYFFLIRSTIF